MLMKASQKNRKKTCKEAVQSNITKESPLSELKIKDATDVLRLASGLSGDSIRLNKKIKLTSFSRAERRALLSMLENSNNLENDISLRKENFKKLFFALHPGDYKNKFPKCVVSYNKLYNNKLRSDNSLIENKIIEKDSSVFEFFKNRPGIFVKNFHRLYKVFGEITVIEFQNILRLLTTIQIVQFKKYLTTINDREFLLFAPNGSWKKVQQTENNKCVLEDMKNLVSKINMEIKSRLNLFYPEGFFMGDNMDKLKIQTNDQKLENYGRGTSFDIPKNIKFIRTSTYWNITQVSFLDNTWNFFDENWKSMGVCCWNNKNFSAIVDEKCESVQSSVFSGDAVNNDERNAAQLIDLYLDDLNKQGVRYAVWSALSFSNIPFSEFGDAHAGMQMGEDPEKGELFEASRVNLSFPLLENEKTKIIAYLDVRDRKIIYCDVNKSLAIESGDKNLKNLEKFMPAYIEYLETIPSFQDIFGLHEKEDGIPMLFSDKEITFNFEVPKAFVLKSENTENIYKEKLTNFNNFLSFKGEK
jgi:hypothetical protein